MKKLRTVPIGQVVLDPNNPRKQFLEMLRKELAASIQLHGVLVPLITFEVPQGFMVADGRCRYEAALSVGIKELDIIVLPHKPDEGELLAAQLTINGHRTALNPLDEFEAFSRLMQLKNWTPSDLAMGLAVNQAEVTRVLSMGKLAPEERELVRAGKLCKSAAYAITRMRAEQRAAWLRKAAAGEVSRDQLNAQARKKNKGEDVKTRRVSCVTVGGTVSVQGKDGLNLTGLIELLEELVRECKKARSLGVDISTAVRMLRDRSQAKVSA